MKPEEPVHRRSTYTHMPVSYGAVGASREVDLLKFPPDGTTPFEESVRLGSGQERFMLASTALMTWGAQHRAGFVLSDIVPGDGGNYDGISYDAQGEPTPAKTPELHYGPDGEPYLTVGTRVNVAPSAKEDARAMLVIYVVDEPRRIGFAWGSTTSDQAVGEELFTVEHRTDDSVWAVARGFIAAPVSGLLGIKGRNTVKDAIAAARAQIEALAPGSAHRAGPGTSSGA